MFGDGTCGGLHQQLEAWHPYVSTHLSNLTLPVHHKHQLSSHVVFTCNLKLLVHHSHGLHAVTYLLGPLAVPNHHGSAVLFHRSMQRAHPVLLTCDTSMSFNPQSQTPNTTVPNFVPMLLHYNHAVPRVIYGLNTDGVDS